MPYSVKPNEDVPYEIRYADDDLLVVEKPPGVVTQPGRKHAFDSLLNGLFARYGNLLQNLGEARDWGLLHRLDKDTSGLLVVGLRPRAYDALRRQFENRQVRKTYWAIVRGQPVPGQGVIQKPIAEITGGRKKAVLRRGGKPAITAYRVLQAGPETALVEARPKTGRLHQVRIHLASMGHPLLGDPVYGESILRGQAQVPTVPRLCLHAAALSFVHPATNRRMNVQSLWPQDLSKTLKRSGLRAPQAEDAS